MKTQHAYFKNIDAVQVFHIVQVLQIVKQTDVLTERRTSYHQYDIDMIILTHLNVDQA